MNRRTALKSLAALPLVPLAVQEHRTPIFGLRPGEKFPTFEVCDEMCAPFPQCPVQGLAGPPMNPELWDILARCEQVLDSRPSLTEILDSSCPTTTTPSATP